MGPKRFVNQNEVRHPNSYKQFQRWRQERMRRRKHKDYSYIIPHVQPDLTYLHHNRQYPSVTWVGHSTFLIQLGGLNIITDPVWAGKMAFQKRLAPPGIPLGQVPPIDVVLISHSHYDHLSIGTLRRLKGPMRLLVPAGLGAKLRMKGFSQITEVHWWDHVNINGVNFTFVPAQHSTRRNPWDTNQSLWGGWVMEQERAGQPSSGRVSGAVSNGVVPADRTAARPVLSDQPVIYFAGDSGYFEGFKEIGVRKAIDLALMPIGAYEPEWFMGPQHVTPEQALQAFEDVKANWFVPMHYGSFKLADDTPKEALDRLENERMRKGIQEERIILLSHGETWKLAGK